MRAAGGGEEPQGTRGRRELLPASQLPSAKPPQAGTSSNVPPASGHASSAAAASAQDEERESTRDRSPRRSTKTGTSVAGGADNSDIEELVEAELAGLDQDSLREIKKLATNSR